MLGVDGHFISQLGIKAPPRGAWVVGEALGFHFVLGSQAGGPARARPAGLASCSAAVYRFHE